MRRLRLSSLLLAINVGLLLLAVAGVAIVAVRLLQRLADTQALARVEQSGMIARQQLNSASAAMVTSAQLLSERPTLRRLIDQNQPEALTTFLAQFQHTSQLDGAAVIRHGQVFAQSGVTLPWAETDIMPSAAATSFVYHADGSQPLLLGAWAPISALPDTAALVVQQLDQSFARQISDQIGVPVTITARQAALAQTQGPEIALRERVLNTREIATARVDERAKYVAIVPISAPSGEVVGLIETELPTAGVTRSVQQLVTTLLLLALGVTLIAGLISLLVGRRLGRPLKTLTRAAARIGRGDLATPIPRVPSAEIGTLAATLEEMRSRLLRLTDDLRRQQAEAEAIVTGIVEGVFSVDRERRMRYLNPQAAAMLGTTSQAAIGRFCGDVLQPEGPGGVRPCAEHCPIIHARFRGGARATEQLLLPNGRRRTVVITSAPASGGLQVQVLRDETEIEATRRLRDSILANISHEFRTPLSAQLASIELLLDQLPVLSIDQIGQLVQAQQRGTLRLTQLIDNLLESARIEAGQSAIRRQPVALDEVVEEALELTHPLLNQRKQAVVVELPYPLPPIYGDSRRLTQVFVNLLANANKFAPADSTITVGGTVGRASVTIWVADQGPGLPQMAGPGLFNRFVRSTEEEPEQSGVGLGLWLVKSIVERHGGQIDAQSNGHGTRMCVVLPLEQSSEDSDRG